MAGDKFDFCPLAQTPLHRTAGAGAAKGPFRFSWTIQYCFLGCPEASDNPLNKSTKNLKWLDYWHPRNRRYFADLDHFRNYVDLFSRGVLDKQEKI